MKYDYSSFFMDKQFFVRNMRAIENWGNDKMQNENEETLRWIQFSSSVSEFNRPPDNEKTDHTKRRSKIKM